MCLGTGVAYCPATLSLAVFSLQSGMSKIFLMIHWETLIWLSGYCPIVEQQVVEDGESSKANEVDKDVKKKKKKNTRKKHLELKIQIGPDLFLLLQE